MAISKRGYAREGFYKNRAEALKRAAYTRKRGADAHVSRTETKWPEHKHYPWSLWTRESVFRDMVKSKRG